jgi:hypothetical protein
MNDDGHAIALFMGFLTFHLRRSGMVEPSDFGRLLPVCCPPRDVGDAHSDAMSAHALEAG